MRKFVLLAVVGFGFLTADAQSQTATATKVGYADVEYIISQMPESKQVDTELKSTQTMLKNQIEAKAQDFQKKMADYNANLNTMIDAVRQNTERELTQMQDNLQKLQQDAQTTIQNKQTQLLTPIYDKIGKAIKEVAKENGFTFVLSSQIGGLDVVLYGDEKMEVSDMVLKKMGVTPVAKTEPKAPTQPK